MFTRMIDDIKESTGAAIRMTSLAAAIALALLVTVAFLAAAAFVYVLQTYGPVQACLTGAGIFLFIALIGMSIYAARKREAVHEPKEPAKSALHTAIADPVMLATALQVARAIGVKKLIPILAVGGLALGFLANRASSNEAPAE